MEEKIVVRPLSLASKPDRPELVAGNEAPEQAPPAARPSPTVKQTTPPPPVQRESRAKRAPEFTLPEPDYPTRLPSAVPGAPGDDAFDMSGEGESEDRPALPYHRPTVSLEGRDGKPWILVRFEVAANGTFKVEMLEGTGDIHQDARVLNALRRWKWLPMRIDGQTYPSVEVLKLYRRDV